MNSTEALREALAGDDTFRRLDRLRATAPVHPRDARIWFHYARTAGEAKNDIEARDALSCGLALAPESWRDCGVELAPEEIQKIEALLRAMQVGDTSDRIVLVRRVHERWPDHVPTLYQYARSLEAQGRHPEARMHNDRAQSLCPFLLLLTPATRRPAEVEVPAERFTGQIAGHYRIQRLASTCFDTSLFDGIDVRAQERPVTLWLIDGNGRIDADVYEDMVAGFRRELRHVVPILEFVRAPDGTPFLVLERIHGRLFGDVMGVGKADPDFVVDIAWHAARSLRHLHDHSYQHGNVLPTNLVILDDNIEDPVAFLDSGQDSRRRRKAGLPLLVLDPELRKIAEEQRSPMESDVFGIGLLLFMGLTGKLPPKPLTHAAIDQVHYGTDTEKLRATIRRCLGLDGHRGLRPQAIEDELRDRVVEYPSAVPAGCELRDWILDKPIGGASGAADLWRAYHRENPSRVAVVKIIRPDKAMSRENRYRFELEALRTPRHPGIVEIFDVDKFDRYTPYYVMEYLAGPDLDALISAHGAMPLGKSLTIAVQVAEALAYSHDCGVVHRDVNARNVVCVDSTPLPRVKLIDFGVARLQHSTLTQSGIVLGKCSSIAPEQWYGSRDTGELVDVYALGALIYHCVSGTRLFGGNENDDPKIWMRRHTTEQPALDVVPAELRPLLTGMLEKEPARRLHMRDVVTQLHALAGTTPGSSLGGTVALTMSRLRRAAWRPPAEPAQVERPPDHAPKPELILAPPPRRPWPRAVPTPVLAVTVVAMLIAGAVWFTSRPEAPRCEVSQKWSELSPDALHLHLQDLLERGCKKNALAVIRERQRLANENSELSPGERASVVAWLSSLEKMVKP